MPTFIPRSQTAAAKRGVQGKEAEDAVAEFLADLALNKIFDYERNYDARSSSGHNLARRCGDFTWYMKYRDAAMHGVIEVKETNSTTSLPYANFENHQIGKLLRRKFAGGNAFALIHIGANTETPSWVWASVEWLQANRTEERKSWDLRTLTKYTTLDEIPAMAILRALATGRAA